MFLKINRGFLFNSLAFRLTCWYAGTFIVFLVVTFFISFLTIDSILAARVDEDLLEDVDEFKALYDENGPQALSQDINRETANGTSEEAVIYLFDSSGRLLWGAEQDHWQALKIDNALITGKLQQMSGPQLQTQRLPAHDVNTRLIYAALDSQTVIVIGEKLDMKKEVMALIFWVFGGLFVIVVPVASAIGWLIARKAVVEIDEVSRAAVDIQGGKFDRRVLLKAHSNEIQRLVDTFNTMADRIRHLINEMREMIDNIAHDLRSPLARIRATAESTLAEGEQSQLCHGAAVTTIDECDRLIQLINTTLDVAEAEAGVADVVKETINLTQLTEGVCDLFSTLAEEKHIRLQFEGYSDYWTYGNRQNLQRMVANLLDNAIKYTVKEGEIAVVLTQYKQQVLILVRDSGIGIPEPEQSRIFDRFYRCDQSRSETGCGLGLSFSRAVARNHGGDIYLRSQPDCGSEFTVVLPACHSHRLPSDNLSVGNS